MDGHFPWAMILGLMEYFLHLYLSYMVHCEQDILPKILASFLKLVGQTTQQVVCI